ncbi:NUDIX hydrolase [Kribbella sp. NPDC051952]|uniref:NUDIX hydrolase n=1 Tax=Kribbella sp. NPDC051952 TaxID=3154851 RepID=UPI0034291ED0
MVARIPISVALLVRDGLVLLVHRHPARRWYPDAWSFSAGGHVEPGELPHQAVRRECREELAIIVHDPIPIPLTVNDPTLDVHGFLITRWDGNPVNAAPEEHDDLRWFHPTDLAALNLAHPETLPTTLNAIHRATAQPEN